MILFLYGTNSYLKHQRVQVLLRGFQQKYDTGGFNIDHIDGSVFSIDEFRKFTRSGGLFAQKRFILFSSPWQIGGDEQKQLIEELSGITEDTIVCIDADMPPRKDNALFKHLLNVANVVEEYADLNHSQLRAFIQAECKQYNAAIDAQAMQQLINIHGNDLWSLSNELHKLAHYDKQIKLSTVEYLGEASTEDAIFAFTDALGRRDERKALSHLHDQFALGANAHYLITMIARHISTLFKVKQTRGEGLQLHSFVIQKAQEQSKRFTAKELLGLYWKLLQLDERTKTTSTNPQALIEQFVLDVCASANNQKHPA